MTARTPDEQDQFKRMFNAGKWSVDVNHAGENRSEASGAGGV
jgi:hypothetical protein